MKPDFEIPLIYLGADGTDRDRTVHEGGALEDIALTLLEPVGLEKPAVMTGRSLPE
jgi:bisphosphoglycerate-independent phosphoglycerate mutase (AlkP superfamily)